eukprot:2804209-Pleurochrysis_carterae.AAC.1
MVEEDTDALLRSAKNATELRAGKREGKKKRLLPESSDSEVLLPPRDNNRESLRRMTACQLFEGDISKVV